MGEQRYFNRAQAAQYIGYSYCHFGDLVKRYNIPKKGPHKNKYCRKDLDIFMDDSSTFIATAKRQRRRSPGTFRPVIAV